MKTKLNSFLSTFFVLCILCIMTFVLFGCTTKTPSVQIAKTITQNAEDAKTIIYGTTSLEQCKNASVAQINAIVRQANDAVTACQAEVASEKKDTRFWFWAFIASCTTIFVLVFVTIKRAIKITP